MALAFSKRHSHRNESKIDEIAELHELGFSKSVIASTKSGQYTTQQLQKLKDQKRHMHAIIAATKQAFHNSSRRSSRVAFDSSAKRNSASGRYSMAVPHQEDLRGLANLGVLDNASMDGPSDYRKRISTTSFTGIYVRCNYKCCHACRPFMKDRLPMSFDAVIDGEVTPLSGEELGSLPVMDVRICQGIGLRKPLLPAIRTVASGVTAIETTTSPSSLESSIVSITPSTNDGEYCSDEEVSGDDSELRMHKMITGTNNDDTSFSSTSGQYWHRRFGRDSNSREHLSPPRTLSTASSISLPATPSNQSPRGPQSYAGGHAYVKGRNLDANAHGDLGLGIRFLEEDTNADASDAQGGVALLDEVAELRIADIMAQA